MANITKRNGKYRVRVTRNGTCLSETFHLRKDAESWGRQKEIELERGELPSNPKAKLNGTTLGDLVTRYKDEVSTRKKGKKQEQATLNKFLRHPICSKALADVTVQDFAAYRDERLSTVTPITLKRELAIIQNAYRIAANEWMMPIAVNPVDKLAFSAAPVRRDRRLEDGELDLIVVEAKRRRNPLILPIIYWAIESGMRRGEVLAMRWKHLNLRDRSLLIPETKTDTPRRIPLSLKAMEILEGLDPTHEAIFPIAAKTLQNTFDRMLKKIGIEDFHWHDFRREGVSRLFEAGLSIPEVQVCSGHKSWKMLSIYTQPKTSDILKKLDRAVQL